MRKLLLAILALALCCIAWGPMGLQIAGMGTSGGGAYTTSYDESSSFSSGDATPASVPAFSSAADGSMIIAFVHSDIYNNTITPPSGFTSVGSASGGSSTTTYAYYKEASSESGPYSWSGTANISAVAMLVFTKDGGSWVTPTTTNYHSETGNDATSATITTDSVTSQDGSMLVVGFGNDGNWSVSTAPDMDSREDLYGDSSRMVVYTESISSGGSETRSITWASTDQHTALAVVVHAN